MVRAYVREDNPQALANRLSPVHTHNHTITFYCTSTLYKVRYMMLNVGILLKGTIIVLPK